MKTSSYSYDFATRRLSISVTAECNHDEIQHYLAMIESAGIEEACVSPETKSNIAHSYKVDVQQDLRGHNPDTIIEAFKKSVEESVTALANREREEAESDGVPTAIGPANTLIDPERSDGLLPPKFELFAGQVVVSRRAPKTGDGSVLQLFGGELVLLDKDGGVVKSARAPQADIDRYNLQHMSRWRPGMYYKNTPVDSVTPSSTSVVLKLRNGMVAELNHLDVPLREEFPPDETTPISEQDIEVQHEPEAPVDSLVAQVRDLETVQDIVARVALELGQSGGPGATTADAIVAWCVEHKKDIPRFAKMRKLEEMVRRALGTR